MQLFYQPQITNGIHHLDSEESKHCIKVLRHKAGDVIHITDGLGVFYEAKICVADPSKCTFSILSETKQQDKGFSLHLVIAPTKNIDRMEWLVEKAVEIGVDEISFIKCSHSERPHLKLERLEKKIISAMKQSVNSKMPVLHPLTDFPKLVDSVSLTSDKFIAYVDESHPYHLKDKAIPAKQYVVLIGPEGDFSKDEINMAITKGFLPVSLGRNRLRTETAGIVACVILNIINE